MIKRALFPGSFDPVTKGHLDIVLKGLGIFDEIVIGVGSNSTKQALFTSAQRIGWLNQVFEHEKRVKIKAYTGLTVAFCKEIEASYILRGLRSGLDFEYEQSIAFANKELEPEIDTVFMLSSPSYSNISSTIVRDIIRNKGNYSKFVPEGIVF